MVEHKNICSIHCFTMFYSLFHHYHLPVLPPLSGFNRPVGRTASGFPPVPVFQPRRPWVEAALRARPARRWGPWKFDHMAVVDGCLYIYIYIGWLDKCSEMFRINIRLWCMVFLLTKSNKYIANKCKMHTKNLWNTVLWDRKIRKWKSMDPQNGESVHESLRIINPSM